MRIAKLKRPALCCHCGAELEIGQVVKWYPNGAVYGTDCHDGPDVPEPELYCERRGFNRYSNQDRDFARRLERGAEILEEYED